MNAGPMRAADKARQKAFRTAFPSYGQRPSWGSRLLRLFGWGLLLLGVVLLIVVIDGWRAFGTGAEGARLERMARSPQWHDGGFVNPQPILNNWERTLSDLFHSSPESSPRMPVVVDRIDPKRFATPPADGLRVTWMGHSSTLVEIDGLRVLTDPMWGERTSPLEWIGPKRWFPAPIALDALPPIDAVVISHDHYDHLDFATITAMKDWNTTFVVPLGVGAHLEYWGVPANHIVELDWWERTKVKGLDIVCTPARHASGRFLQQDKTLWAGWALVGPQHRVYYSGDTGLFPAMEEIGAKLGPFDLTMIETGQYGAGWPDWHLGPEQAVLAHRLVKGRLMLPVHWGLVTLAYHGWTEPIERSLVAAKHDGVGITAPRPGQDFLALAPLPVERWWPDRPWKTAEEAPIVASQIPPKLREGHPALPLLLVPAAVSPQGTGTQAAKPNAQTAPPTGSVPAANPQAAPQGANPTAAKPPVTPPATNPPEMNAPATAPRGASPTAANPQAAPATASPPSSPPQGAGTKPANPPAVAAPATSPQGAGPAVATPHE
ncbi:MBL fold metallo-hydrolase [Corallococcus carmarthensis]|uniref:MBL fold metallo-hydrolase n=1 Tax=Corallococcus carmarthensis TaxID=2316728 RepID=UPI00244A0811|nr:MBL fold metallo-hydrolase [Corallococcus carmarthensis]